MDIYDGKKIKKDVLIIGGGPAGMAAMDSLYELGITDILLAERSEKLGGLLEQCIHDGFGLIKLGRNYSGPEYADVYISKLGKLNNSILRNATVTNIREISSDTAAYPLCSDIATANGTITIE